MEFKPALPQRNDNVTHDHPLKEFASLLLGLALCCAVGFLVLGWLVDVAVERISPEMEAKIFAPAADLAVDKGKADAIREKELQRLVDEVRGCIQTGFPLKVSLVRSDKANAMALPGGRIVVLEGLLAKVRSENGLAFVLAHELAHFNHRDHLRAMGRGLVLTTMAAMVTGSDSGLTQWIAPAVELGQARYSQERERMADVHALEALVCRYGHAGGATEFFEAMKPAREASAIEGYFSSHPEAMERIRLLEERTAVRGGERRALRALPAALKPTG